MGFWNQGCADYSNLLWKPSLLINHQAVERNHFKCKHPKISFNYYSDNIPINNQLQFTAIPVTDNTNKKTKLRNQLLAKESKRFEIEKAKKNCIIKQLSISVRIIKE